jgi:multidrug efflux pump subunit AcrA (membrane-fusion protein)
MTLQPSPQAASPEAAAPAAAPPPAPLTANGSALPKPSRLPRAKRRSSLWWLLLAAGGVLLLGGFGVAYAVWFRGPAARTDLVTYHVEYKDLQLKIVERGSLEAGATADVKCEVKTGSRGAAKIKWVVENGAYVNKGDLLVDIDDSYLQEQARGKKIDRDNAEALKVASEQTYPQKKVAISLAEQAAEKWIKGDYPQQLHDLESQITIAKAILQQQQDRTTWVGRMVKKGYMTASQEQAEEDNLNGDQLSLQNKQELKKVLVEYTDPYNRKSNENAVKQAHVDERTAYADMLSKKAVFEEQDSLYKDLMEQISLCKISAPSSGIVVYYVPEQTRGGFGATQSIIAQGEPVQYNQTLLRIPDLSHMLVNLRIHEAFINLMRNGLPCSVRVDAAPGRALKGHVKSVAAAAAQQDWMSPDVKVYQAAVEIDDSVEQLRLKPGLSAVTTIYTETKAEHVLAIPVQTVLPPLNKGDKPSVFVATPKGVEKRELELGMSDQMFYEVKDGLHEGDEVVLDPKALLSDKEKKKAGKDDEKIVPTGGRSGGGRGRGPGGGDVPAGPGGGGGPGAGRGGKPKQ